MWQAKDKLHKRKVVLEDGSVYRCKAVYFSYEVQREREVVHHAVSLFFPRNPMHLVKIVDANNQLTWPKHRGPAPEFVYKTIDQNQEGKVGGLFYIRVNHPTKLEAAAERRRDHLKVSSNLYDAIKKKYHKYTFNV